MSEFACDSDELCDTPPVRRPRRRITRRLAMLSVAMAAGGAAFAAARPALLARRSADTASRADWDAFASRFLAPEGRVIDTGNGGMTHTEGQGYGLLFAEHFDDRATFDRLLDWTERTLRRSGDALHAWRYQPDAATPVSDRNNATDGDLMIAWALLRAGERWGNGDYTAQGQAIAADLLRWCTRETAGLKVLLPAAYGFERPGRVVVNPSYYVFPAFAALAKAAPDPAWERLRDDGLRLLRVGSFGRWKLPADWLEIRDGRLDTVAPAPGWPARFSWDAVRVPLNLVWAGLAGDPAIAGLASFWEQRAHGRPPAWASLTDNTLAPFTGSCGMAAICQILHAARTEGAAQDVDALGLPHVADAEDYYASALVLLARIAWHESREAALQA